MNFKLWAVRVHNYKIFNMPHNRDTWGWGGLPHYPIFSGNIMYNGRFFVWILSEGFGCLGILTCKANGYCSASTHSSDYEYIVFYELLWFQKAYVFIYTQLLILRKILEYHLTLVLNGILRISLCTIEYISTYFPLVACAVWTYIIIKSMYIVQLLSPHPATRWVWCFVNSWGSRRPT